MVILTKKTFEDVVGGFQKLTECEFRREHETPSGIKMNKKDIDVFEKAVIATMEKFASVTDLLVLEHASCFQSHIKYLTIKAAVYKKIVLKS
ncbi:hypothetical protein A2662_04435 [Candidatus Giovannonibacteria bacterium RIFCSPHIGHO2_01_FULL_45_33]|uniref:Uncharacterized protein n=1 Tax=Candidatus Giovannonibacteria bacterium RIFCSPLOWO2_01_FULL_45_34 TaxID=1798351 RepID=A0A1F5X0F5_9BACT|nr:MAG: hypothetical protein A2662_04435 [Candidatus Giovannonibacteria bacterium RIFCSPHIGHO2_01_FULL_45_33]OGF70187.1 MAG: hypothetical protein A3C73_04445 [Candidatus Giovannonibacteria bacterium RIFCSPHIGHO2_02_FULL_44_11]OGF81372.1 MAG: hypothetical protein A2930_00660 [Candidatus Giovannonibacteria bacterium RIFCSPLOWO2_01_FULL_45_34]